MSIYPTKLKKGDEVRVVAPSRSLSIISEDRRVVAERRFGEMGLELSFGAHVEEKNDFNSSSVESRVKDLHDAFSDEKVKAVITVIGGYNSNQLLKYIDWEVIKNNPKIFCGYSDITVLCNAIFAKTKLVTYYGPHYSSFGQQLHFEYTLDYFKKCLFEEEPFKVEPSKEWSDDPWQADPKDRHLIKNSGFLVVNEGTASGAVVGGNLCTFNLLQGTDYIPDIGNCVLFVEDDDEVCPSTFDRDLQSLIHLPNFNQVKGVVIGRFQKESKMSDELLFQIVKSKKELTGIPVIANVDFGHTDPKITFPIGGLVAISSDKESPSIVFQRH